MPDWIWEIEEGRNADIELLSAKERQYLATGKTGSYSAPALDRRIAEKVTKLPNLLQAVFDDISLLYHGDFLEQAPSEELTSLSLRGDRVMQRTLVAHSSDRSEVVERMIGPVTLGYEFGSMFRMFQTADPDSTFHDELLLGIMLEFANYPTLGSEARFDRMEKLVERSAESADNGDISARTKIGDDIELEFSDLTSIIGDEVLHHYLELAGIHSTPALASVLRREYMSLEPGHLTDPPLEQYTRGVNQLLRETELDRVVILRRWFDKETENLRDSGRLGVDVVETLSAIWGDGAATDIDIAEQIGKESSIVTQVLNKLSSNNFQPEWATYPVVQKSNSQWSLTPYGDLCCEYLFERESVIESMHIYATEPHRIETVKRELYDALTDIAENALNIERDMGL